MKNVKGKQNKEIRLYLVFRSPLFDLNLQEMRGREGEITQGNAIY